MFKPEQFFKSLATVNITAVSRTPFEGQDAQGAPGIYAKRVVSSVFAGMAGGGGVEDTVFIAERDIPLAVQEARKSGDPAGARILEVCV